MAEAIPGEVVEIRMNNATLRTDGRTVRGSRNDITGNNNTVLGDDNIVIGHHNSIRGNNNQAFGKHVKIDGNYNLYTDRTTTTIADDCLGNRHVEQRNPGKPVRRLHTHTVVTHIKTPASESVTSRSTLVHIEQLASPSMPASVRAVRVRPPPYWLRRAVETPDKESIPHIRDVPTTDSTPPIDKTCAICCVNERRALFVKCGHTATCLECAVQVPKCPVCRTEKTAIHPLVL